MTCSEMEALLGASLDGELDAPSALLVDRHTGDCPACATRMAELTTLRDEIAAAQLNWGANTDLRRLSAAIRKNSSEGWWRRRWNRALFAAAAVVLLLALILPAQWGGNSTERQMIDNHLRSLMANHLVDVPSSDKHTVKPWFQGKLTFAPTVPDLSSAGFVLIGGRLDVVNGKEAAALVYRQRGHIINLWTQPADGFDRRANAETLDGFHLLRWQRGPTRYWAVSDLNEAELREMAELVGNP